MELQGFVNNSSGERIAAARRSLAGRDGSHARGIAKLAKAKIKIVHVFEPEIMMTDAANFRDLVQRFTGKPPPPAYPDAAVAGRRMKKKKKKTLPRMIDGGGSEGSTPQGSELEVKEEVMRREFEEERMMVMASNNSCGSGGGGDASFLGEFEGIDFFLEELGDSINCMPPL